VSTGASNDIERATNIARKMVTQWGLSEKLGPMLFAEEEGEVFLGRTSAKSLHMSDETAKLIDEEIKSVVGRNYERAETLIKDNLDILHAMKDALVKYETIDALQIDDLMARVDVRKPSDWDDSDSSSDSSSNSSEGGAAKKSDKADDSVKPDLSEPSSDIPTK
jgi:cell division protease FtsH